MKTNLHFNFNKQCYGKTLNSKLHAFAKKDRRHNHAETWPPSLCQKEANVLTPKQRYSIKPPTEGMGFAAKSPPIARNSPPPSYRVYTDRCIMNSLSATVLLLYRLKPLTAGSLSLGSLGQLLSFRSNIVEYMADVFGCISSVLEQIPLNK